MTLPTSLHIHERGTVHDPDSNASFDAHRSLLWPQGSSHDTPKFSEEILHAILSTRKSWKTLKGQAEAVWPPYLEATMLKALQEYVPEDSRETRILGRFPMRNRFISDYIYRATGKYRSAKQVGSRLQQLRDTVEGREMIDSLTRCYRAPARPQSAADHICSNNARTSVCQTSSPLLAADPFFYTISAEGSSDSCSISSSSSEDLTSLFAPPPEDTCDYFSLIMSPSSSALKHPQTADSRTPVYIDILPEHSQSRWASPTSPSSHSSASSSIALTSAQVPSHSGSARHMRDIDPIVTFVSPTPINGKSSYIVLLDGAPIHSEDTKLVYVGPYVTSVSASSQSSTSTGSTQGGPVLYNTALVPKYWDILSKAANPTLYTIIQDVYRAPDGRVTSHYAGGVLPAQPRPRPVKIFSAVYHFRYPPNAKPGGGYPSYSLPASTAGPGYSLSLAPSNLSSSSVSPMLALKPGLGNIGYSPTMSPAPSGTPMGAGQYAMHQQLHPGYASGGQYRSGHSQGYTYGAYPPTTTPTSSAYHASSSSYMSPSTPGMASSEALMLLSEEDFFRFDDAESPTPSSSGGTGSNTSGSGVQSSASFFPKDMNTYF